MTQEDFLAQLTQVLDSTGIPFMLVGSQSSSFHGQARATNDVDLVIDPTVAQLQRLLSVLGSAYYVSPEAAREALRDRSMFNIIDFANGWKAGLIIRKNRPFSVEEFKRRKPGQFHGRTLPIASPDAESLQPDGK